jgi:hypothetical protein
MPGLFGIDLIDIKDFAELVMRMVFNFAVTFIIVRYIYYPRNKRQDYLFTFLMIGLVVFLLTFLLENVKIKLGFALGLFAVFGIIRYRTTTISIKEMTYLFIVIGISIVNALSNKKVSYAELILTNFVIMAATYFIEKIKYYKKEYYTTILYNNIDLVKPQNHNMLIEDIENRLGVKINRIEINNYDFDKNIVKINVYFYQNHDVNNKIDYRNSIKDY